MEEQKSNEILYAERERRMKRLREKVTENNVYRWAGRLLTQAAELLEAGR